MLQASDRDNGSISDEAELRALLKSIRRIVRGLDVQSRRIDREVGLTLPQLVVLQSVDSLGEVASRVVSENADLSPPTVVGILDKLETKGLVDRYRSTRDRRVVHARLTAKGAEALARAPSPLGPGFDRGFLALDPAERARTLAVMARIARLADAADAAAPSRPAPEPALAAARVGAPETPASAGDT